MGTACVSDNEEVCNPGHGKDYIESQLAVAGFFEEDDIGSCEPCQGPTWSPGGRDAQCRNCPIGYIVSADKSTCEEEEDPAGSDPGDGGGEFPESPEDPPEGDSYFYFTYECPYTCDDFGNCWCT